MKPMFRITQLSLVVVLATMVVIGGGIAAAVPGCSWWQRHGSAVTDVVVDCGTPAVKAEAEALLPAVLAILTGQAPDWQAQLDALRANGEAALFCAVAQASSQLGASPDHPAPQAVTHGKGYLSAHHVTVKGAK